MQMFIALGLAAAAASVLLLQQFLSGSLSEDQRTDSATGDDAEMPALKAA
ncbi:MAG TPA: hypothetical protein VIH21_01920 [Dehalococcoidia bacterium]|jgi:hypothetical protein